MPAAATRTAPLRPASWPWSAAATAGALAREAQRSAQSHRHAVGGVAGWDLTFGHGAQASPASSLNHMNCLEHVYHKVGPSGVPPPRARALSRECYAYHIRLFLGRLWDHSKDSCMSLFHPFANCHTHGTMTVALVFESQLSRCRASTWWPARSNKLRRRHRPPRRRR